MRVPGRHDLARAEVAHGLAERADVRDDGGPAVADRGRQHTGRVGPSVRKHGDGRVPHHRSDLVVGKEAEAPFDPRVDAE